MLSYRSKILTVFDNNKIFIYKQTTTLQKTMPHFIFKIKTAHFYNGIKHCFFKSLIGNFLRSLTYIHLYIF
jgi:hypothetical protein